MSWKVINRVFFGLILLLILDQAQAQGLSGRVVDQSNSPVIGAYILVGQLENHAHTNQLGEFSLKNVDTGDTLHISSLGYKNQIFIIENLSDRVAIILEEEVYRIDEVVIKQGVNAINQIAKIDLVKKPVQSSQEVLRVVPGLFVAQHAGGGKAEQIFLRGFDIDHGTDLSVNVEGMPVNMVSHAHGQGYADLHFLIPEVIENIDYNKGPYYSEMGNFATAGYVDFKLKDKLEESKVGFEIGDFNSTRFLGLLNLLDSENTNFYLATGYSQTDGPFKSSQNFDRLNVLARLTHTLENNDKLNITLSHFASEWDASGQIPFREVLANNIGRFGAIDDTEGGSTSRTNAQLSYQKKIKENMFLKTDVYFSKYDFELWSNFTFFLRDSINGDQIAQREERNMFGATSELNYALNILGNDALLKAGLGMRNDKMDDIELSYTKNRKTTLEQQQFGDINETNAFSYLNLEWELGKWLFVPGVRFDHFKFQYQDQLAVNYVRDTKTETLVSPKFNMAYNISPNAQVFFKSGFGFHSNDTRVVISESQKFVPKAFGADVGTIFRPMKNLLVNTAVWYLRSEQEFVYVGDEGIVEPSGESERIGLDLSLRYQFLNWLYIDTDWTYAKAKSTKEKTGENNIPLAPSFTGTGGVHVAWNAFDLGLQFRYMGDRAANEDNSIIAEGYFVTDLNFDYSFKNIEVGISVQNLLNTEWEETQFATETRLQNELESVEEIHFTPGTPMFIRGRIHYMF